MLNNILILYLDHQFFVPGGWQSSVETLCASEKGKKIIKSLYVLVVGKRNSGNFEAFVKISIKIFKN
jgi:hypothetical protein